MWFRNLRLYRLSPEFPREVAALERALATRPLAPCGSFEMASRGWVFPRAQGVFVHAVQRHWLIALGVEEKLLPSRVVRQVAQARATALAAERGHPVGRREMRDLVERALEEMLPKAFTQRRTTWGWLDPTQGWLAVDAGSDARADEFVESLTAVLAPGLLRCLRTQTSAVAAMTAWLAAQEPPDGFTLDDELELRNAQKAQSAIRYVHHDLAGPEIPGHLAAGKLVTRLKLTWREKISFVLAEPLQLKRLSFLDLLKEQAGQEATNADELFDAHFVLMAGELAALCADLVNALGGEAPPA